MKVATWNVNSIRARLDRLTEWLTVHRPDVLLLQETKVTNEDFPFDAIGAAGYHATVHGQRTYNGVAVLSLEPLGSVAKGFEDGLPDDEARLIAAEVKGVTVVSVYVPNGKTVDSPSYGYKLEWLGRLRRYLDERFTPEDLVIVGGDINIAPEDRDVARPEEWRYSVLCHPTAREELSRLRRWGLLDTFRLLHEDGGAYSWWDYRALSFPKNNGLRIDQIYTTAALAPSCRQAYIDREARKGEKPSDHAPVVAVFE